MGLYDTCDRYLMSCLNQRSKDNQKDNMRIVVPIIKLKAEQFKQETINLELSEKYVRLEKILNILDGKLDKCEETDVSTTIKAQQLKQNLHKKLLSLLIKDNS